MKIIEMPKNEKKISEYLLLLKNSKTFEVRAETYEIIHDEEGNALIYRFLRMRKPVLEIEAIKIDLIVDKTAVDVDSAVSAVLFKKRNRGTK